ncbi:REST corepressor spr-1 [Toxocara canis]|uniref:REST corepressor spr-1 n=1 Tax=Toxocara canis TaxID=6265 RepID=A0A0B2UUG0_TOXCA|nr:REST corepressor spr-1 [Toxocara canis]
MCKQTSAETESHSSEQCSSKFPTSPLESRSEEVRVGAAYQADLTGLKCSRFEPNSSYVDRDECLWCPSTAVSASELDDFLEWAKTEGDISEDAALYILQRNGYSTRTAMEYANRLVAQKISGKSLKIFKNCFQLYERQFHVDKMKRTFPHFSKRRIVDMYFLMKGRGVRALYSVDDFKWSDKDIQDIGEPVHAEAIRQLDEAMHEPVVTKKQVKSSLRGTSSVVEHVTSDERSLYRQDPILREVPLRRSARLHSRAIGNMPSTESLLDGKSYKSVRALSKKNNNVPHRKL